MHGALLLLLADALFVPAGVLTSAYLTRRLGPEGYGIYSLAVVLGMWIEWGVLAAFSRATIKFVGESSDWRPVGATALRINLLVSGTLALAMMAGAGWIAVLFDEPALVDPLRAYALTIVAVVAGSVHSHILVGTGQFHARAAVSASYAGARLLLVIGLVGLGLGPSGAILGLAGASTVSLMVARYYVQPSLRPSDFPWRRLIAYAWPLFLYSTGQRVLGFLDLALLKLLGRTIVEVGYYGAAQNVALAMNMFVLAITPLLLSELTRALRDGDRQHAEMLVTNTFRWMLLAVPMIATVSGCAGEVLTLVSGAQYLPAAGLVPALAFGALFRSWTMTTATILVAIGRPRLPAIAVLPLVPIAIAAQVIAIPIWGAGGAALVTLVSSMLAAASCVVMLHRHRRIDWRFATAVRSLLLSLPAYWLAAQFPAAGGMVVAKVFGIGALLAIALAATGEFGRQDLVLLRKLVPGRKGAR